MKWKGCLAEISSENKVRYTKYIHKESKLLEKHAELSCYTIILMLLELLVWSQILLSVLLEWVEYIFSHVAIQPPSKNFFFLVLNSLMIPLDQNVNNL